MMVKRYDFARILIRKNIRNIIPVCVYYVYMMRMQVCVALIMKLLLVSVT